MRKPPIRQVLEYYPQAVAIKIKNHFEIYSNGEYLGKGKTIIDAWKAASRNIND